MPYNPPDILELDTVRFPEVLLMAESSTEVVLITELVIVRFAPVLLTNEKVDDRRILSRVRMPSAWFSMKYPETG